MLKLDMRCSCSRCTERTKKTYKLPAHCTNCGSEFLAIIRFGDKPSHSEECPICGVSYQWVFGTVEEANQIAKEEKENR